MSSFLWSPGFGAHAYKLSFPTIADVIDIADASFMALALMKLSTQPPTTSKVSIPSPATQYTD